MIRRILPLPALLLAVPLAAQQPARPPRISDLDRTMSLTMAANVEADLSAGRDPALARAIATLGGAITPEQAGRLFRDAR